MTLVAVGYSPPSTLADVIGQVRDAFQDMGDATPIMIGKQYLEQGVGSAPRVVFVPEPRGRIGPPQELGNAASVTHSCDVAVRGQESGDDLERFKQAYAIGDRVIDLIKTAATGRIEWGDFGDGSPTDADAYGAEVAFSFTYTRDVPHDAERWALDPATADDAAAVPLVPPGEPASDMSLEVTVEPQE